MLAKNTKALPLWIFSRSGASVRIRITGPIAGRRTAVHIWVNRSIVFQLSFRLRQARIGLIDLLKSLDFVLLADVQTVGTVRMVLFAQLEVGVFDRLRIGIAWHLKNVVVVEDVNCGREVKQTRLASQIAPLRLT